MSVTDVLALPQVSPAGWGARKDYDSWNRTGVHDGTVVHYTGGKPTQTYLLESTHDRCDDMIRGIERFHLDSRGWNGIGYNFIICPHGILFRGRGEARGAHNPGDSDGDGWPDNLDAIGVLLLIGGDEQPTPASLQMLQRVCDTMNGEYVVPHSASRQTTCPGDHLRAWINDYNEGTITMSVSSWAQAAWDWAKSKGIVKDDTDPKDPVNKEELMVFLKRYFDGADKSGDGGGLTEAQVRTLVREQVNSHADNPDAHHE